MLAAHDLRGEDVSRYGVLDVDGAGNTLSVQRFVEKPAPGTEPSHLVALGRFVFTPDFFVTLRQCMADHTGPGEYHYGAALDVLGQQGRVVARVVDAPRQDVGAPLGYVQAFVRAALDDPRIGDAVRAWLQEVV